MQNNDFKGSLPHTKDKAKMTNNRAIKLKLYQLFKIINLCNRILKKALSAGSTLATWWPCFSIYEHI